MRPWRELSRQHRTTVVAVAAAYLLVIVGVLTGSPLVRLDWAVAQASIRREWPGLEPLVSVWIRFGQRGPALGLATVWLAYRGWRSRSLRPLLVLAAATLMLNVSVGVIKIGLGRLGPNDGAAYGTTALFEGGTLFPSGHTANAVVTWGVLAYVATRHRRAKGVAAGLAALTIGLAALYEGYHWVSDILAGWAAGALVMLLLPIVEPAIARAAALASRGLRRRQRQPRLARIRVTAENRRLIAPTITDLREPQVLWSEGIHRGGEQFVERLPESMSR